jgi:hypothetical protein
MSTNVAQITQFNLINPTHIGLEIESVRPFILKFNEPYDPIWTAKIGTKEYNSLMIFPSINAFLVDQTGKLTVSIQYESQAWFIFGIIFSTSFIAILMGYSIIQNRQLKSQSHALTTRIFKQQSDIDIAAQPNTSVTPSKGLTSTNFLQYLKKLYKDTEILIWIALALLLSALILEVTQNKLVYKIMFLMYAFLVIGTGRLMVNYFHEK